MSKMHQWVQDPTGQWVPARSNSLGTGGSGGGSGALQALPWKYAAATGGITNTSAVELVAAPGAGKSAYLCSLQVANTSATATEISVLDGSTVIWRSKVGASMISPVFMTFEPPLMSSNNAALNFSCATTSTATFVNAQGFVDRTIDYFIAQATDEDELFDDLGNALYDANSNRLYA